MRSLINYLIGNILTKGIGFISIPIYTYYLSVESYGQVAFFNSSVAIFSIVLSSGLYFCISREIYDGNRDVELYITAYFIALIICFLPTLLFSFKLGWLYTFIVLVSLFRAINTLFFHLNQPRGFSKKILSRQLMESIGVFLISYYLLENFSSLNEYGIIIAQLFVFFVLSIIVLIDTFRDFYKGKVNSFRFTGIKSVLKRMYEYSAPVFLISIISALTYQIDKLYISFRYDSTDLGYYSLAFNLAFMVKIFSVSVFSALTPKLMKSYKDNNAESVLLYGRLIRSLILLSAVFIVCFSGELVNILSPSRDYTEAIKFAPWIAVSFYIDSLVMLSGIYYSYVRNNRIYLVQSIVTLLVYSLALNYSSTIYDIPKIFLVSLLVPFLIFSFSKAFNKKSDFLFEVFLASGVIFLLAFFTLDVIERLSLFLFCFLLLICTNRSFYYRFME